MFNEEIVRQSAERLGNETGIDRCLLTSYPQKVADLMAVRDAFLVEHPVKSTLWGCTGVELIRAERYRQQDKEGWTPEHDDQHINGELRDAAIAYAMVCNDEGAGECAAQDIFPGDWGEGGWWKPSDDPIRNLVKAGALIAAEIDRLQRQRAADEESAA